MQTALFCFMLFLPVVVEQGLILSLHGLLKVIRKIVAVGGDHDGGMAGAGDAGVEATDECG
jgi:hypothetical protein